MSIRHRIIQYFHIQHNQPATYADLAAHVTDSRRLIAAVGRMLALGELVRLEAGDGEYLMLGAVEETWGRGLDG